MNNFYNDLLILSGKYTTWIDLVPILVGIFYFKRIDLALKWFLYYKICILGINISEQLLIWGCRNYSNFKLFVNNTCNISNTFFINIFIRLSVYIFLGYFFSLILSKSIGDLINKTSISLFFIAIFICVYIDGFHTFGTVNAILCSIYILLCCFAYLQKSVSIHLKISLFKNPYFLISVSLFLSVLLGLLLSLFSESLQKYNFAIFVKLSILSNFIHLGTSFIYCIAFHNGSRKIKSAIM